MGFNSGFKGLKYTVSLQFNTFLAIFIGTCVGTERRDMISERKFHGPVGNQTPGFKLIASYVTD